MLAERCILIDGMQESQSSTQGLASYRSESEALLKHCSQWVGQLVTRAQALQKQILPTFEVVCLLDAGWLAECFTGTPN